MRERRDEEAARYSAEVIEAVRELRKANRILRLASAFFAPAELDRRFIDQYRHAYGVESICRVMQAAPSG